MCSRHMGVCMDIAMANGELTQVVVFLAGFAPDHRAAALANASAPLYRFLHSSSLVQLCQAKIPLCSSIYYWPSGHETSSPTRTWSSPGLWVAAFLIIVGPHTYRRCVKVSNPIAHMQEMRHKFQTNRCSVLCH